MKHFVISSIICAVLLTSCNSFFYYFRPTYENAYLLVINDSSQEIEWSFTAQSPSESYLYTMYPSTAVLVCHSATVDRRLNKLYTIEDLCSNLDEAVICAYSVINGEKVLLKCSKVQTGSRITTLRFV